LRADPEDGHAEHLVLERRFLSSILLRSRA